MASDEVMNEIYDYSYPVETDGFDEEEDYADDDIYDCDSDDDGGFHA